MYSFLHIFRISNITVIFILVFHMTVSQCYVNQHTVSAEDLWDICRGKKAPYWSLKTLYVSLQTSYWNPEIF